MSERTRLATGPIGEMQALGAFGRPVHSLYAQLHAVVRARLSDRHAALFAEPVLHSADNRIDWYAPAEGEPVRLVDLPPDQAQAAAATLRELSADLEGLAGELSASSNDSDQALGHLIRLALSTPDDSHIHVIGDQPVLTYWGFARGAGARTTPLYGYGGAATRPAAAEAAPAAAAAVARGSALPWVMWSFAALLLLIAVLLLLRTVGGVDVPGLAWLDRPDAAASPSPGQGTPPTRVADRDTPAVDDSALVAARERERVLRTRIAALQSQLDAAQAACPTPQTPPRVSVLPDRDTTVVDDPDRPVVRPDRVVPLPGREPDGLASLDDRDPIDTIDDPFAEDPLAEDPPADEPVGDPLGAPLTIDQAARDALDLAALEGGWRTGRSLMDLGSAAPLEIEYAFNGEGEGISTIRLDDGTVCTARAEAAYNGPDAIVIRDLDYPACSDGSEFEKSEIVCLIDEDGSTICEGAQPGGSAFALGLFAAE